MGNNISVSSYEEMENASKKLQQLSESYDDISRQLLDKAQTMGAAWEGSDNEAYVKQIMGIQERLKVMSEKLSAGSKTLHQQKENYMNLQSENVTQVGKLMN